MRVYTVGKKTGFNTDREYQAYVDLLEEMGVDVADVPRTPEPGTENRWLYVWHNETQAQRFARELQARLRDRSFYVHGFEIQDEQHGPLAPLTILAVPTPDGTLFRLESRSQGRVMQHFPNARLKGEVMLPGEVLCPTQVHEDGERERGQIWDKMITTLTGLPQEAVEQLGGIQVLAEDGRVLLRRRPADTPQ